MSKRQELREKRHKEQQRTRILATGLVVVGALAIALFLIYPSFKPAGGIVSVTPDPRPQANFNAMGDPNAPVKIEEFSDFQCPYCDLFWRDMEQKIVDVYVKTGKVYFIYRSAGEFIGRESRRSAEAAYCAGDQGKFWEYHDILFTNQNGENQGAFVDRRLVAFAQSLDLDMNAFESCFNSGKYSDMVTKDGVDSRQAGVSATPSFVINGKLVEGALPFDDPTAQDDFKREIDAALAAAGGG
jgi:protein-disulfide isomerase